MDAPHRLRRMTGRDPAERDRASTPLELLFDLSVVVAVGVAAEQLAEYLVEGHLGVAVVGFVFTAFAIYWAWLNYSWFASAFDTDDWLFRVMTMVQMVGVTVLALGIGDVFRSIEEGDHLDNRVVILGYVVMRLALVGQWIRVAYQSPRHRRAAFAFLRAVVLAQVIWVVIAFLPLHVGPTFAVMVVAYAVEVTGPLRGERGEGTPWHAHHIAERYSLFAIIALGEGVVGTLAALTTLEGSEGLGVDIVLLAVAGIGLTFGMWWVYFLLPSAQVLHEFRRRAFPWSYGHIVLFAGIIATGSGLHVAALSMGQSGAHAVEGSTGVGMGPVGVVLTVAVPLALYVVSVFALYAYLVHDVDRFHLGLVLGTMVVLVVAVLCAAAGVPVPICLLVLVLAPAVVVVGYEVRGYRHVAEAVAAL